MILISWLGIVTNRKILVVGSMYHSPSFECKYDEIDQQKRRIIRELSQHKKQVIFMINGDINSKHEIWGSTETDARGEYLLDWMGENKMTFLNNGDFTYKNANGGKDVLDIMMMDMNSVTLITKWSCQTVFSTRYKNTVNGKVVIDFSDHRAMVAKMALDPRINDIPDKISWNFDESKKQKLQNEIKIKMRIWEKEYEKHKDDPDKIDQLVEMFQLLITTTAQSVLGYRRYQSFFIFYFLSYT